MRKEAVKTRQEADDYKSDKLEALQTALKETQTALDTGNEAVKTAQKTLADTEKEIRERGKYKVDQEKAIATAESEGNDRLLELRDDITILETHQSELEGTKTALQAEIDDIIVERDAKALEAEQKLADLNVQIGEADDKLKQLLLDNEREEKRNKAVTKDTAEKLRILEGKEKSVLAKRDALILERQQLEQEKQRFYSTKAAYDI